MINFFFFRNVLPMRLSLSLVSVNDPLNWPMYESSQGWSNYNPFFASSTDLLVESNESLTRNRLHRGVYRDAENRSDTIEIRIPKAFFSNFFSQKINVMTSVTRAEVSLMSERNFFLSSHQILVYSSIRLKCRFDGIFTDIEVIETSPILIMASNALIDYQINYVN